jgi:hypothetical protein
VLARVAAPDQHELIIAQQRGELRVWLGVAATAGDQQQHRAAAEGLVIFRP